MPKRPRKIGRENRIAVKAVIPAAGLGTRFRPLTFALPKELLPVKRKPLIQWALEEALEAGIQEIGIVIRKGKEIIREYLEALMSFKAPKDDSPKLNFDKAKIHFVTQKKPLGLGDAMHSAAEFVNEEPFVMILPDQFVLSAISATRQLLGAAGGDVQAVWSTLVNVSGDEVQFFPGARRLILSNHKRKSWKVTGIREQQASEKRASRLAFGRTLFPSGAMKFFSSEFSNPATGEIDLKLSFVGLIKAYHNYAVLLEGEPMDFGTWPGYERYFH